MSSRVSLYLGSSFKKSISWPLAGVFSFYFLKETVSPQIPELLSNWSIETHYHNQLLPHFLKKCGKLHIKFITLTLFWSFLKILFIFSVVVGFELRALHLLGRGSSIWPLCQPTLTFLST
jgi:hypothetical protein